MINKAWTTNNDEEIEIGDLTDSHLVNIIKMLRRKVEEAQENFFEQILVGLTLSVETEGCGFYPILDKGAMRQVIRFDTEAMLTDYRSQYPHLVAEAKRRGLKLED